MTREAKIGMLTGLFVIVLIGVLLSEYLGGASGSTRMAGLTQLGDNYRKHTMDPVGIPGMARAGETADMPRAFAAQRDGTTNAGVPVMPVAGDPGMGQVATRPAESYAIQPLQPQPAGPVLVDPSKPTIPLLETADSGKGTPTVYVAVGDQPPAGQLVGPGAALTPDKTGTVKTVVKEPIKGQEYTIAKGDTLNKIARKYYKSDKPEDRKRIIAANPGTLKDESTMLVIGKKLLIPDLPKAVVADKVAVAPVVAKKADTIAKKEPPLIFAPGAKTEVAKKDAVTDTKTADAKKDDKTGGAYVVQSGDTLEKIAKKVSAKNYRDVMKRIVALNKLDDPNDLTVGTKLKLPGKV